MKILQVGIVEIRILQTREISFDIYRNLKFDKICSSIFESEVMPILATKKSNILYSKTANNTEAAIICKFTEKSKFYFRKQNSSGFDIRE